MIHNERIKPLNLKPNADGEYVLYWMQQSQRAEYNHALEYAIEKANELNLPLIVFFGLTDDFPEANERHYYFMLEGLLETQKALNERGIKFVVRFDQPDLGAVKLAKNASIVVCDRGYLLIQKEWRNHVAESSPCTVIQVETDVIVPVESVSNKEEYSAGTFRPKLEKILDNFLVPLNKRELINKSINIEMESVDITDIDSLIEELEIDHLVQKVESFHGGISEARKLLSEFIKNKLSYYDKYRNNPNLEYSSNLSPYLHFGQISPLEIALKVRESGQEYRKFFDELITRRELSMNFCNYNDYYDFMDEFLPDWAYNTLMEHAEDDREYLYSSRELENAQTHDKYWNAAQNEMVKTGKMHNYMRMYWGKKIIEWTDGPYDALRIAIYLNNKYSLDGRDPNSFAGIAWCFGKHDRAWGEREIFGKLRYMSSNGLDNKFNMEPYLTKNNVE